MFSWIWSSNEEVNSSPKIIKDSCKSISVIFATEEDLQNIRKNLKPVSTNDHRKGYKKLNPVCEELERIFSNSTTNFSEKNISEEILSNVFVQIKQVA